jgi:CRP-like cAMP-binding protein
LRELPLDVVKGALAQFDSKRVTTGDVVLEEGATGHGLYVVLSGALDVVAKGELGQVRLKTLGAGDVFGEMSLLSGEPASASVVAAGDSALLFLEKDAFAAFARANPALEERLRALASTRADFNARFLAPDETSSAMLV